VSGLLSVDWEVIDPNTIFHGLPGYTYSLIWTICNNCGSSSDTVMIGFTSVAFNCGDTLFDTRDGQFYTTVQIGTQCWMAENLNTGTLISGGTNSANNGIIEKYCYADDTNNCNTYGGLYQWNEAMQYNSTQGVQGICPFGWHFPTDTEWTNLGDNLGGSGVAGGKVKEAGTTHWQSPNTGATNSSGFTGLPGGNLGNSGTFNYLSTNAFLWSSTEYTSTEVRCRRLQYYNDNLSFYEYLKTLGFSVRCLKN